MSAPRLTLAANRGDVAGGEVMLLALADAARRLGLRVRVVAPSEPGDLVALAEGKGFETVALAATRRTSYAELLRRWDSRHRTGVLWCNGLLPVVATTGHPGRVAHLHQAPRGPVQRSLCAAGVRGTRAVVVPSLDLGRRVAHTAVLPNWTCHIDQLARADRPVPRRIGYLGRFTRAKGVDVLTDAVSLMRGRGEEVELVLAGDDRFADAADRREVERALAPLRDCTRRLGWTTPEDFFGEVDLAVFPSSAPEPFGLVAAEAMAFGIPFVISDAGALPEVGGAHPWIARHGDPMDLARVVTSALHAGPDARARSVSVQRRRWEEHFSPMAGTRRLAALLKDLGLPVETPIERMTA